MFIPQAFEANASSSGGIQTLNGKDTIQGIKISTMKSESKGESRVLTLTFKLTKIETSKLRR